MIAGAATQFGYQRNPDQDRPATAVAHHPSSWSGRGRSGFRSHSTSPIADIRWWCSMMPTGSGRDRGRSAFRSVRWSSGIGLVSASVWSARAWCGASARSSTEARNCISSTCCRKTVTRCPPSSTCSSSMPKLIWWSARPNFRDQPAVAKQVVGLEQRIDHAVLTIDTPEGPYRMTASHVVACDGARSSLRQMVGADFAGQVFEDQFLIADVKMAADSPPNAGSGSIRRFTPAARRCCIVSRTMSGGLICSSARMRIP